MLKFLVGFGVHALPLVLVDTGTKQYTAPGTSASYTGMTVSATANLLVIVVCFGGASAPTGLTATWDSGGTNQAMTSAISHSAGVAHPQIFYLLNPTAGNKTLALSWTNACEVFVDGLSFSGASTSSPIPHTQTGTTATINVTSAVGHYVIAIGGRTTGQGTNTGTLLFDDHASGASINCMAEYDIGASPTVTIGNTLGNNAIVGVDVSP